MALLKAQELEAIGQLAIGIAQELNTPAQYVADNLSFLRRALPKLWLLLEAQSDLIESLRAGGAAPPTFERVDAARSAAKLDYLARQVPRAIEQSLEGLGEVNAIVKAMKQLCRPGGTEKQPTDIHDVIESTSVVAKNEWRYVADLQLDFDWDLPPVLLVPSEFSQVMLSLLVNAAHAIAASLPQASADKGKLVISTRAVADQVEVRVSDTGAGIPEAEQCHVFEPFLPGQNVGARQDLAMAHAIVVDQHGGSLGFETELDRGTTFVVRLPLSPT